jgi:predicted ABC-type ATPase
MKTYTIIGGVNGVGKSSPTGALRAQTTALAGYLTNLSR